ncbi:MAG TPA: DNA polymerase II large subunit, partial [Candidatus Bathyarchaeia archaeon]|nr:DNA polymerase II large subunit [Candidatus Bathyarchaeia archaeon]
HPFYTFFWDAIRPEDLHFLRQMIIENSKASEKTITLPNDTQIKSLLEKLCLPHRVADSSVHLMEDETLILRSIFEPVDVNLKPGSSTLEQLSDLARFPIRSKAPTFVGARMGRPEKAKERVMTPKVHCLFPTGQFGGTRRDIIEASRKLAIILEVVDRACPNCNAWEPRVKCPTCGSTTVDRSSCPRCGLPGEGLCRSCGIETVRYKKTPIDLKQLLEASAKHVGLAPIPEAVKGAKGLLNRTKTPEPLEKGLLRARCDVSVFKDGTIRFDSTNAILTQFRPGEVGLSLEKAHALGYERDMNGQPLDSPSQLCALDVQDLIVPETGAQYLLKASKFIDDLLSSYYGFDKFYNASKKEDLIGRLVVGLSPHTSVGVVGRIVGFTKASVCYAHPFWHAAKRRDCDGDEDSISLLLDVLLNFSREFMPDRIGGLMDAPLLLSPLLNPSEVARQALNIETIAELPVEFYDRTWQGAHPSEVETLVPTLNKSLGSDRWSIGFTHPTENLDHARLISSYKELPTMLDKVKEQLQLADQIVAVRGEEVAVKVLSTHILRDLVGNLRTFTSQRVRCTSCGSKPRRVPLGGKCHRCGGKLVATVFRGGVEKYLDVATEMVQRYKVRPYYHQRLDLIKL